MAAHFIFLGHGHTGHDTYRFFFHVFLLLAIVYGLFFSAPAHAAFVCVKRSDAGTVSSSDYKSRSIPARYQEIEWRVKPSLSGGNWPLKDGQMIAKGYTDSNGDFHTNFEETRLDAQFASVKAKGMCGDVVVPGGSVKTQFRMRPLVPEGNTNWTSWVNLPSFTPGSNKTDLVYVTAPKLREKIRGNPLANDIPVRRTLPLYATQDFRGKSDPKSDTAPGRVAPDPAGGRLLVIDSAKTPNTEGLHAYTSPAADGYNLSGGQRDLAKTDANLHDNGGVIVIKSLDLKYDYESCADYLINEKFPDAGWFGLNDCLGRGMYSNTKIFVAKRSDVAALMQDSANVCESRVTNLENTFREAIKSSGGIQSGLIPGYFWSGSSTLSEQFNSSHTISLGFDPKRYSVGKSHFINLPLWDVDDLGAVELAILLIESDDGKKNDVIACHDHVDVKQIVASGSATLENSGFLAAQPDFQGLKITDILGETTAVLELGFESNVDTYQTVLNATAPPVTAGQ